MIVVPGLFPLSIAAGAMTSDDTRVGDVIADVHSSAPAVKANDLSPAPVSSASDNHHPNADANIIADADTPLYPNNNKSSSIEVMLDC